MSVALKLYEHRSVEARLLTAIHRQTVWTITAVGAVVGLVRLLDYLACLIGCRPRPRSTP